MTSLQEELSKVELSEPTHFRNLTLFSLLRHEIAVSHPDYLLLDEAIAEKLARVTELNGGSVPELCFENHAGQAVLLLDGEELIGAKQNRVLNLTILAPPKQRITIPVSCVEAGRWHGTTAELKPSSYVMFGKGRAQRAAFVSDSMRAFGTRRSDQSAVWEHIAAKMAALGVRSRTSAMSEIFERHSVSVEAYVSAFTWCERQAGVVCLMGDQVLGLDLFDHPATMRRLFSKLLRSYALDAIDGSQEKEVVSVQRSTVPELVARMATAKCFVQPAVGLGQDLRFSSDSLSGAALWAEGRYVHIYAFPNNGQPERPGFRNWMIRPTHRRRF
jgi:hypothetical protein